MEKKKRHKVCYRAADIIPLLKEAVDRENYYTKEYVTLPSGGVTKITRALRTYGIYGTTCSECGLTGDYFLEFTLAKPSENTKHDRGLILYSLDKNGNQILFSSDHIIPSSFGGSGCKANMQTMCWPCNGKKSNHISTDAIGLYRIASVKDTLRKLYGDDHPQYIKFYEEYVKESYIRLHSSENEYYGYVTKKEMIEYLKLINLNYNLNVDISDLQAYLFAKK